MSADPHQVRAESRETVRPRHVQKRAARGYTLMELMVGVAIVAILTVIAIASYRDYVDRARRAEGRQALTDTLQQMERYYTANNRFVAFTSASATAVGFRGYSGDNATVANYLLSAAACGGSTADVCVVISAAPNFPDSKCGSLTLSTNGARLPAACW